MRIDADDERFARLEAQVAALLARVVALETARPAPPPVAPASPEFDLLARLQSRAGPPYDEDGVGGAVAYAGAARFAHYRYGWQIERPVPGLLALEEADMARVLAALSHPFRLRLVRALLHGPRSRQHLQDGLGQVSTGQFYHHLKELLAAGLVIQRERNAYELGARHVIPLLTIFAATYDLMDTGAGDAP